MKNNKIYLVLLLAPFSLTGAGCFGSGNAEERPLPPGGVYVSKDRGANWTQIARYSGGGDITRVAPVKTAIDPFDTSKIYIASGKTGLLRFDAAAGAWTRVETPASSVLGLSIHPNNPNILYIYGNPQLITRRSKVWKSFDAGITWREVYTEPAAVRTSGINFFRRRAQPENITSMEINPARTEMILLGSSAGTLLSSRDGGTTWSKVRTFNQGILGIKPSPRGDQWFVLLQNGQLVRTSLDGQNFEEINIKTNTVSSGALLQSLQFFREDDRDILIAGTNHGLFRSQDNGNTWSVLPLPVSDRETVSVNAVAGFSPIVYAGSGYVFYASTDRGNRWKVFQFPITNSIRTLLIDPLNPNVVYAVFMPS